MCQKCHLKEIPHEQQTPLEQDLICKICHILQIGNLNDDLKYMIKWRLPKKVKLASASALTLYLPEVINM